LESWSARDYKHDANYMPPLKYTLNVFSQVHSYFRTEQAEGLKIYELVRNKLISFCKKMRFAHSSLREVHFSKTFSMESHKY